MIFVMRKRCISGIVVNVCIRTKVSVCVIEFAILQHVRAEMRLQKVIGVTIASEITAMNESNDLKFSQHMMIVRKVIVYDASIVTPNLSLCDFAVDIGRSLTSRCEITFDCIGDEA